MARIQRPTYLVVFNTPDGEREEEVTIAYGDQLRGELEAGKQGLPPMKNAPQNHVAVWLWCALVRLGLYPAGYQQFRQDDLVDVQPVTDENGNPLEPADVDPTAPVPSGPA